MVNYNINHTDDEVGAFHPICKSALQKALEELGLDDNYQVIHHYPIGQIVPDFVILNKSTDKILLIIEVKRKPSQVKSTRYKDQARSYILEAGSPKLETPYYVLTNLEVTNFFKYDPNRTSVNKQMLAPSPMESGYFNRTFSFTDLVENFKICISTAKSDSGRFLWGYGDIVEVLARYDLDFDNWHTAFTVVGYEFIRSVLSNSQNLRWRPATYYQNNPRMLQNIIGTVNFTTLTSPDIIKKNDVWEQSFLDGVVKLASNSADADELTSAVHEYLVKKKSHLGVVPTDLELATALVALTIDRDKFTANDIVCDPAAGGGNLIAALIEYFNEVEPKQIKVNDISDDLSHLLSLRLGLRFPKSISPDNSPKINNQNIIDLPEDYFSDVSFVLLNPPYLSGVANPKEIKNVLNRIRQNFRIKPITGVGQVPLEGPFLEYLLEKIENGTAVGVILPKSHLFGLGKESAAIRKLLIEKFGLTKIFLYPRDNLFNDVIKETVILVGEKGNTTDDVVLIQTTHKVSDININDLSELKKSDVLDIRNISRTKLNLSVDDGWRTFLSDFDIPYEISKDIKNSKGFPNLYRGKAGNKGATDVLFITKHPQWDKVKGIVPQSWLVDAIENTNDINEKFKYINDLKLKCLAPPENAFQVGTTENQLLEKIITTIQVHSSSNKQGKQLKKTKTISDIIKIIRSDSSKIVPAGSLIIPRNLRKTFKAYICKKPVVVSTNFFVIEKQRDYDMELIYSWLFSVFGQIQLEFFSKPQEGARKSEKFAFTPVLIPDIDNFPGTDDTSRTFYDFGIANDNDREWAKLLEINFDKLSLYNEAIYDLIMQRNP
ncbi:BpuSI family type II restriction endonuclease [Streptococcus anginosus]|uniref:BpuSI family type II restriction endonuclease n=1 Tax=Streptococcus anginosus TaxID=1328 RepID=UPI0012474075|nr:BpuSI family type II restriction endonuclease [Streptococcus anginosus]HEQ8841394.1 BpuSI family type II restriction endonuclease [Streptococcus pyogenes]MCW1037517.1 BpuSI family type II restriction endonuclease [Streptococcus anginosus]MED5841552.1 BpuSI family type II restriction endonuclease [Streptococcus anginosus]MED5917478.1 BpuSI family type II restriction endonuclease [Streptococcus anginosus]MED5928279.1 BpuSI family type II restriction endonuclease [Streptococcus anginosus]